MERFDREGLFFIVVIVSLVSCKSTPPFQVVQDKEWRLVEVRIQPESIRFDRQRLVDEGFGDIFVIRFDKDQLSGKGAPNQYRGPYEPGENQSLKIGNVAGTLMAPIREPERFKEREYFAYLANVYKWNIEGETLELYTKNDDGQEAVMVYVTEQKG
jgi:heat shock protein HslJ